MNRYPLKLRKLEGGQVISIRVNTPEEEAERVAEGWSIKIPALPEPAADAGSDALAAVFSTLAALTERIDALTAEVAELKAKRGPGRPPKEPK